jgi:hypothetical protein
MFESIPANVYVLLAAGAIVLTIYLLVTQQKPTSNQAHLLSQSQENLTGVAAFMLSGASVSLSITFALVLAFNPIMSLVFVIMFAGFALVEFIASFHLSKNWNQGRVGGVFFSLWLLIGGISISILAGQGILHIAEEKAAKEAMLKSNEYERFLARQQEANDDVKRLAIAPALVTKAKSDLSRLENEHNGLNNKLITLQNKLDNCPKNYFKNCINPTQAQIDRTNTLIAAVQSDIVKAQAIIEQQNSFLAAKALANELNNKSFAEEFDSNANKGIDALAIVLNTESEIVSAYAFLYLAIFCELSAIIAFYLWGQSRFERMLYDGYSITTNGQTTYKQQSPVAIPNPNNHAGVSYENRPVQSTSNERNAPKADLFNEATLAVQDGIIRPSKYALQQWTKTKGLALSKKTVEAWQTQWLNDGLIKETTAQNGKRTFKLTDK